MDYNLKATGLKAQLKLGTLLFRFIFPLLKKMSYKEILSHMLQLFKCNRQHVNLQTQMPEIK